MFVVFEHGIRYGNTVVGCKLYQSMASLVAHFQVIVSHRVTQVAVHCGDSDFRIEVS